MKRIILLLVLALSVVESSFLYGTKYAAYDYNLRQIICQDGEGHFVLPSGIEFNYYSGYTNKFYFLIGAARLGYTLESDLDGIWTQFYDEGKGVVKQVFSVENGKLEGECLIYHETGHLKLRLEFEDGKIKEGHYCEYYANGMQKQSGRLVNGCKSGEWREWSGTGGLKSIGKYNYGQYVVCGVIPSVQFYEYKIGEWSYYNQSEELIAKGIYKKQNELLNFNCENSVELSYGEVGEWIVGDDSILLNTKVLLFNRFYDAIIMKYNNRGSM